MRTPFAVIVLFASVLSLGACDKASTTPPTPQADRPLPAGSDARAGPVGDPSVPSAESALGPANTSKANPTVVAKDGERSPAQVSKGVPLPGQNNDHSAPLDTAKRASSP
jgi:hypothetical protein